MINTLGIVHVPRSPAAVDPNFARKLVGKSLLERVVRRVTDCQRLDAVVVVPGDPRQDQVVARLVPPDVVTLAGRQTDALSRFVAAIDQFGARAVVRVCASHPFIDPVLIDRLVRTADAHPASDYIGYCRADGRLAGLSHVGVFAEWCSADALRHASKAATRSTDRDRVTPYVYGHPETFSVRLVPLPPELDRNDVRLRIDVEEDWEHAQVIYDALGHDEWDWQRLAELLDHQPALRRRMAVLNRTVSPA
jgi:spore coat polysaccharide biosynthesis protein SpsF